MEGPLGTGLLCCGDSCDPCCSQSHADTGECCVLECPCFDQGADCALSPAQCVRQAVFYVPVQISLAVPLTLVALLSAMTICFRTFCPKVAARRCKRTGLFSHRNRAAKAIYDKRICSSIWRALNDLSLGGVIALLVWVLANVAAFAFTLKGWGFRTFNEHWSSNDWLLFVSAGFGNICAFNMLLVSIPATHTPLMVWLFGLPFDKAVKWHRWIGRWTVISMVIHGAIVTLAVKSEVLSTKRDQYTMGHIYGLFSFAVCLLFVPFTLENVRRKHFEWFQWTHLLTIVATVFAVLHSLSLLRFMWVVALLYITDWIMRLWAGAEPVEVQRVTSLGNKDVGAKAVLIEVVASEKITHSARGGCFFFINAPTISQTEWHPISILTCPAAPVPIPPRKYSYDNRHSDVQDCDLDTPVGDDADRTISFLIKSAGKSSWSERLTYLAYSNPSALVIRMRGPHGRIDTDSQVIHSSLLLLCGGGIGVTPLISTTLGLIHSGWAGRIVLIWTFRGLDSFEWLREILHSMRHMPYLAIRLHITQDPQTETEQMNVDGSDHDGPFRGSTLASELSSRHSWVEEQGYYTLDPNVTPSDPQFKGVGGRECPNSNITVEMGRPNFGDIFDAENIHKRVKKQMRRMYYSGNETVVLGNQQTPKTPLIESDTERNEYNLNEEAHERAMVITCGPKSMVESVRIAAAKHKLPVRTGSFYW